MRFRPFTRLHIRVLLCLGMLLAALLHGAAYAQFGTVWSADEVRTGQRVNLFARWDGRFAIDGALVELPAGWTLMQAVAVRQGYEQHTLQILRLDEAGNFYGVAASDAMEGAHDLVFQVETGGGPGRFAWTLTPFVFREHRGQMRLVPHPSFQLTRFVRQDEPEPPTDNRVLSFRGGGGALLLRRSALPGLGTRAAYTVEYWMRTTGLDQVVLSTWNGEERAAYPLELVVDAGGRLRYYRGYPGQHESMATQAPVADGQWHHVALTHNAVTGWTRLFLDGAAADSLYSPAPLFIDQQAGLAVGARMSSTSASAGAAGAYTGLLDELRIWPQARTAPVIRRMMRQPLQEAGPGVLLLGFDEPLPAALIEQHTARAERVFSDLAFYHPVQNVRAVLEDGGVLLNWETNDPDIKSFVVERSGDGRTFEPAGEVEAAEAVRRGEQPGTFSFYDAAVVDQVVFYRVRQRFESGLERVSDAIKLGLGQPVREDEAVLVGNFPNPFNPSTTIGYEVRTTQRVRVSVWDLSGQQVAVLVDRVQQPGYYEVHFEAQDLPSGTYFARLQTRNHTQARQMILTK